MPDTITRTQASKLNPVISVVGMPDTLSRCAQLIDQLGRFVSESPPSEDSAIFLLTGAISSAINYELETGNV